MTREEEIDKAAKKDKYGGTWVGDFSPLTHEDLLDGNELAFKRGARWADSTSPYKKALERAKSYLEQIRESSCCNLCNCLSCTAHAALTEIQKLLEGKGEG